MITKQLTAKGVEAYDEPGRYGDGAGLYLIVDPSGRTKRWVFRYTLDKRTTEMGLGGYPVFSLAEARSRAAALRQQVKDKIDPVAERRAAREVARVERKIASIPTFGVLADDIIKRRAPKWKNEKHADQWRMSLTKLAAPLRDMKVNEIATEDIIALLEPIWAKTPETAKRLRGRIEVVLNEARLRSHIPLNEANPARWQGHLELIFNVTQRAKAKKHHAALPYADAPKFMKRLQTMQGSAARALEFLVLTAARTGEITGARWREIDVKAKIWTVPADRMKAGREHRVPLSGDALAILKVMKSVVVDDFIFPGPTAGTPLSNAAMAAVLRRMAMADAEARGEETHERVAASGRKRTKLQRKYFKPDHTVHGLRSTFRDWAGEETDFSREVCEAALAHSVGDAAELAYKRGDALAKRRALMENWAAFLGGESDDQA